MILVQSAIAFIRLYLPFICVRQHAAALELYISAMTVDTCILFSFFSILFMNIFGLSNLTKTFCIYRFRCQKLTHSVALRLGRCERER